MAAVRARRGRRGLRARGGRSGLLAGIEAFDASSAVTPERCRRSARVASCSPPELRLRVPKAALQEHCRSGAARSRLGSGATCISACSRSSLRWRHAGYGAFSVQLSTGKAALLALLAAGRQRPALAPALRRGSARRGARGRQLFAAREPSARRSLPHRDREDRGRALAALSRADESGCSTRHRRPPELAQALATLAPDEQARSRELAALAATRHEAIARERKQAPRVTGYCRAAHRARAAQPAVRPARSAARVFAYDVPAKRSSPARSGLGARRLRTAHGVRRLPREHLRRVAAFDARARHDQPDHDRADQPGRGARARRRKKSRSEASLRELPRPRGRAPERRQHAAAPGEPRSDRALLDDGISCAACHQWQGESRTGGGGLARFLDGLEAGRTYFGPIADPVGNAFHRSERGAVFATPARALPQLSHGAIRQERRRALRSRRRSRAPDAVRRVGGVRASGRRRHVPRLPHAGEGQRARGRQRERPFRTGSRRARSECSATTRSSPSITRSTVPKRAKRRGAARSAPAWRGDRRRAEGKIAAEARQPRLFGRHREHRHRPQPAGRLRLRAADVARSRRRGAIGRVLALGRARERRERSVRLEHPRRPRKPDAPLRRRLPALRSAARELPAAAGRSRRNRARRDGNAEARLAR